MSKSFEYLRKKARSFARSFQKAGRRRAKERKKQHEIMIKSRRKIYVIKNKRQPKSLRKPSVQ